MKIIAQNKKAKFLYHIEETIEAGIVLLGSEVKSLRDGRGSLADSYAVIEKGEIFLLNSHIAQYQQASYANHDPRRRRKLLLHKKQIGKLTGKLNQKGFTLIPIKLYFKEGLVKAELGLCRGKKLFDKRENIKRRETNRQMSRVLRRNQK